MSQFNLTLKPAQIEIILKPNTTYTQSYDITNNSSETILLSTSVSPWIPADNQGSITQIDDTDSPLIFSLSNANLKLGQDFIMKPGEKKQLVLKIKNPSSEEKDQYFSFFVSQKPLNEILSGHQNLAKLGSNLLISTTQQNNLTSNLQISKLSIKPLIKDIFTPLTISGEVYNYGDHFSQINGQISIKKNGQPYWQQNIFPYTVTTQNSRLIYCLNSDNEATPCQLKTPIWPGIYQGTISLLGNSSKSEYTFQFFVFPYSIIIVILFIFVLFSLLFKRKQNISSRK